jgi:hypothetical protein
MTNIFRPRNGGRIGAILSFPCVLLLGFVLAASPVPRAFSTPAIPTGDAELLDGYRHVEVASVSDAIEKTLGQRMYMSHRMRPIFPSKFAGIALTVQLKKEENQDPAALQGMLAAIDQGGPNSVYVMVVENGADIAGMGGLMGTAMAARNFSGVPAKNWLPRFRLGNRAFDFCESLSFCGREYARCVRWCVRRRG